MAPMPCSTHYTRDGGSGRLSVARAGPPELGALGMADWRQLSVPPYRIIYAVEGDRLTIAVVAHSRRDLSALLERRLLQCPGQG